MEAYITLWQYHGDRRKKYGRTRDAHETVKDLNTIRCHTDGTCMPADKNTQS